MHFVASLALIPSLALGGLVVPRYETPQPTPTYAETCTFYASANLLDTFFHEAPATYSSTSTPAPSAGPYVSENCVRGQGLFGLGAFIQCELPATYTSCTTSTVNQFAFSVCATPTFAASPVFTTKVPSSTGHVQTSTQLVSSSAVPTPTSSHAQTSTATGHPSSSSDILSSFKTSPITSPLSLPTTLTIKTSALTSPPSISTSLSSIETSLPSVSSAIPSVKTSVATSLPSVSTSLSSIPTSAFTSLSSISSLTTSTPSTTKSQSSSGISSAAQAFSTGCFADNINGNGRTFTAASTSSSNTMTNEVCESYCGNLGYAYSGTEYSSECYCSNKAPSVSSTQCTMACSGNSAEICGGSNALSVTYNSTVGIENAAKDAIASSYKSYGCYSDRYPSRVLDGSSYTASNMTVENCAVFCNMGMYSIAGVEYGNQCYCGNTLLTDDSTYGVGNQTGCTFACAGDNSEICGGSNLLNIYSIAPFMPAHSVGENSTPFTAANANGGCASDYAPGNNNVRTLSATSTSSSNMTQEVCSSFCSGYTYYGVEYSTQCYCGNTIDSSSIVAHNCTNTCGGNSAESCGGGWAMNIFTNTI